MSTPASTPTTTTTAAELTSVVTAIPGVRGIEPGITSTLRALDARIRRSQASQARYGLMVEPDQGTVTVEIGVDSSRPVRDIVEDTQRAVQRAIDDSDAASMTVLVRVQSVATRETPENAQSVTP
ncbi:hypothetical protein [Enemella evansiae]|uniref:Uncharacterized protein n=1 Tax=Enemella evansiae TaxID=2016499 RepID=A0A255GP88_9ACTN|nr:hypothetical protein [Enemella evansiae]PFG68957.1 hypothetical protein B0O41_3805 [Propionibacteriaceae bacterium ES.041]OYN96934.1 hypothetical protein CGZ96_11680 [Enemella evansiae]OYO00633.1 hypothetical protein CGZ95_08330 [Enemella evansiae]OYO06224.1 hypothetical protein CGZ97_06160 [Enemella evansiae]OYO11912.1 hypothetical protein CGZ98_06840 [Enemella evansiae]